MKILVMSLLRAGDLVLASPALAGIKRRYPDSELHILVNTQSAGVAPLLPMVDVVHYVDRNQLQKGLVNASGPLFRPYEAMKKLTDNLSAEKFNLLINFTQNKFSAWLSGVIVAEEKLGMTFNSSSQVSFGSPWFRYINDFVAAGIERPLHYSDIFYFGSDLQDAPKGIELAETEEGKKQVEYALCDHRPYIMIQPLTSDDKKNWGLDRFADTIKTLSILEPDLRIVVSGAEFERSQLEYLQNQCRAEGIDIELVLCSFAGVFSLLKHAKLVLTGDTCLKHMACATDAIITELSVGSSHLHKTGAYKEDSVIIQSIAPCTPCPHRQPCSQSYHMCGELISPSAVASIVSQRLRNNWAGVSVVAKEYVEEMEVFRSQRAAAGIWQATALNRAVNESFVESLLESLSWKFLLGPKQSTNILPIGTVGNELGEFLGKQSDLGEKLFNGSGLASLESRLMAQEEDLLKLHTGFRRELRQGGPSIGQLVRRYTDQALSAPWLRSSHFGPLLSEAVDQDSKAGTADFTKLRRVQTIVEQAFEQNKIKLRLLRAVRIHTSEEL